MWGHAALRINASVRSEKKKKKKCFVFIYSYWTLLVISANQVRVIFLKLVSLS